MKKIYDLKVIDFQYCLTTNSKSEVFTEVKDQSNQSVIFQHISIQPQIIIIATGEISPCWPLEMNEGWRQVASHLATCLISVACSSSVWPVVHLLQSLTADKYNAFTGQPQIFPCHKGAAVLFLFQCDSAIGYFLIHFLFLLHPSFISLWSVFFYDVIGWMWQ